MADETPTTPLLKREIKVLPGLGAMLKSLFEHDEAFGLPRGTVRGTGFLLMTGTICYLASRQLPIPAELAAAWGGVVGLYFGGKASGGGHAGESQPHE